MTNPLILLIQMKVRSCEGADRVVQTVLALEAVNKILQSASTFKLFSNLGN